MQISVSGSDKNGWKVHLSFSGTLYPTDLEVRKSYETEDSAYRAAGRLLGRLKRTRLEMTRIVR